MRDRGGLQVVQPLRWPLFARQPKPGMAAAGEDDAEIILAEGALGARGEQAACPWQAPGHRVLAAQAVLQQDQLGTRRQARCQFGNGFLGVIGLAGQQQAADGNVAVRGFRGDGVQTGLAVFDQGQATGGAVAAQTGLVAQDQPHRQTGAGQACGPQPAQAAGAEDVPGAHCGSGRRTALTRPLL